MARRNLGSKLRQKEDADDLAQTTFREAARDFRAYVYRGESSLLRWLVRILQNKIRDRAEFYSARKRDLARERTFEEPIGGRVEEPRVHDPPSADLSVTRVVQRREEFGILREALDRLSSEHRQAIALVFFEGLSLREAGERMEGRSEDAVRMLLRRAEKHLYRLVRSKLDGADE
jgi:RNA polymerase sigma factor (sigma-70 family)